MARISGSFGVLVEELCEARKVAEESCKKVKKLEKLQNNAERTHDDALRFLSNEREATKK